MNKTTWYQRKINLDDGTTISIICTQDISYGHMDKLFECALVAPDGSIDDEKLQGYLDFDQVAEYIRKAKEEHNDNKES
jgi:hypothetical protein